MRNKWDPQDHYTLPLAQSKGENMEKVMEGALMISRLDNALELVESLFPTGNSFSKRYVLKTLSLAKDFILSTRPRESQSLNGENTKGR